MASSHCSPSNVVRGRRGIHAAGGLMLVASRSSPPGQKALGNVGVGRALGMALWTAAAGKLFRPSLFRSAQLLALQTDAVVGSDIVLTLLALKTCPFEAVRALLSLRQGVAGLVASALLGLSSALLRRHRLKKKAGKQAICVNKEQCIWQPTLRPEGPPPPSCFDGITTLYDCFFIHAAVKYADANCFGRRTATGFEWETFAEAAARASAFGAGLRALGLAPLTPVGIYAVNSPEWVVAEYGCYAHSMIPVALYSTLGDEAVAHVVNHSEMKAAVCAVESLPAILAAKKGGAPALGVLIFLDVGGKEPTPAMAAEAASLGLTLMAFSAVVDSGRSTEAPHVPPTPSSIATIMYTSGTTGNPKGVVLTHNSILSCTSTIKFVLEEHEGMRLTPKDRYLSYLPLAHIYERLNLSGLMGYGVGIGFFGGKVESLLGDIEALRPTILAGVPRVYNKIVDKVFQTVAAGSKVKQFLFHTAVSEAKRLREAGAPIGSAPLWDALIFGKIKKKIGGECRLVISGGAPLSASAQQFLTAGFGCPVIQGYGLTETCAGGTFAYPSDPATGHVGPVVPSLEMRIESVPEMNYSNQTTPPQGEVCLRGPPIMQGYYKEEAMTKEVIDADGWFHTGDIGEINASGSLTIIDRRKNIFKLSQGEYVAAEKLELTYQKCGLVETIFVYGDSFQSVLVAVVVPDLAALRQWAGEGGAEKGAAELCALPGAPAAVLAELKDAAKAAKFKGFEVVKAVHLEPVPFSIDNDLITPTFKLKRPQLKAKYKEQIDALYQQLNKA